MAIKISFDELKIISECLTNDIDKQFAESLNVFLKTKNDDYYFYGREPVDAKSIQIRITLLCQILSLVVQISYSSSSLYVTLNSILQSAYLTNQTSVFLYGRKK